MQLAAGAPLAQRGNKRVISAVLEAQGPLEPDVERELIELRRACFQSEDFREGVRAFAEKREPIGRDGDRSSGLNAGPVPSGCHLQCGVDAAADLPGRGAPAGRTRGSHRHRGARRAGMAGTCGAL